MPKRCSSYADLLKICDERIGNRDREFWASPTEQFDDEGRKENQSTH